jgi:hypothetical protein
MQLVGKSIKPLRSLAMLNKSHSPTKLVPVQTSSKVVVGPLASGDSQVTLSHVECLPQALALNLAGPLVALCISLY